MQFKDLFVYAETPSSPTNYNKRQKTSSTSLPIQKKVGQPENASSSSYRPDTPKIISVSIYDPAKIIKPKNHTKIFVGHNIELVMIPSNSFYEMCNLYMSQNTSKMCQPIFLTVVNNMPPPVNQYSQIAKRYIEIYINEMFTYPTRYSTVVTAPPYPEQEDDLQQAVIRAINNFLFVGIVSSKMKMPHVIFDETSNKIIFSKDIEYALWLSLFEGNIPDSLYCKNSKNVSLITQCLSKFYDIPPTVASPNPHEKNQQQPQIKEKKTLPPIHDFHKDFVIRISEFLGIPLRITKVRS
jgi:hypothetical protein